MVIIVRAIELVNSIDMNALRVKTSDMERFRRFSCPEIGWGIRTVYR
ncbi:MAG: hypothetical protein LBR26_00895 [Prevotella sp.]|jgi:hypothetical protein|nr:hypothetical protein [Prevotella sp.]